MCRNGEFEMATASPNNSFVKDGKLYIVPTLTSDVIGEAAVYDGYTYNITGCTNPDDPNGELDYHHRHRQIDRDSGRQRVAQSATPPRAPSSTPS